VSIVWGIGGKAVEKLATAGIHTIADFVTLDLRQVRDILTVTGARAGGAAWPESSAPDIDAVDQAGDRRHQIVWSYGHQLAGNA
jgi:nucleotidyltransferase/DNA polymerase involved in DNA repair